jgi:hypothetical protein
MLQWIFQLALMPMGWWLLAPGFWLVSLAGQFYDKFLLYIGE